MKKLKKRKVATILAVVLALSLLLTACGSGGTITKDNSTLGTLSTLNASETTTPGTSSTAAETNSAANSEKFENPETLCKFTVPDIFTESGRAKVNVSPGAEIELIPEEGIASTGTLTAGKLIVQLTGYSAKMRKDIIEQAGFKSFEEVPNEIWLVFFAGAGMGSMTFGDSDNAATTKTEVDGCQAIYIAWDYGDDVIPHRCEGVFVIDSPNGLVGMVAVKDFSAKKSENVQELKDFVFDLADTIKLNKQ